MVSIEKHHGVRAFCPPECSQNGENISETLRRTIVNPILHIENGFEVSGIVTQKEQFEVACLLLCALPNCLKVNSHRNEHTSMLLNA